MDQTCSVGACDKYKIPDEMIPLIIEKVKLFNIIIENMGSSEQGDPHDDDGWLEIEWPPMTIRVARWMSRLKSSVDILVEKYKNDDVDPPRTIKERESFLYWLLYNIAQVYAHLERISDSLGHEYFDSSETDQLFFMKDYGNYNDFQKELEKAEATLRWGIKLGAKIGEILIDRTRSGEVQRAKMMGWQPCFLSI